MVGGNRSAEGDDEDDDADGDNFEFLQQDVKPVETEVTEFKDMDDSAEKTPETEEHLPKDLGALIQKTMGDDGEDDEAEDDEEESDHEDVIAKERIEEEEAFESKDEDTEGESVEQIE